MTTSDQPALSPGATLSEVSQRLDLPDWDSGPDDDAERLPDTRPFERHRVTAVLVAHDGERWLPRTLAAIAGLARAPERIVAVDTGSTDRTPELLAAAFGPAAVLTESMQTGFGAAVRRAVQAREGAPGLPSATAGPAPDTEHVEWLWLLHDDCAPEPESLRRLLAAVDASGSIAIAGPKVRGWHDPGLLVEIGITAGGGGRRETGLERREIDQGQHDGRRDVLAVGSAGLLIRRDVWDQLDGFDPRLALFRDDLDLGWRATLAGHRVVVVPEAVVHHAEAAAHGNRAVPAAGGRVHRADRRSALHVLLANSPWYALPWHWVRLLVGSMLRIVGLLVGKAPAEALDEAAALGVLFNPLVLRQARRARKPLRTTSSSAVRHLLAPPLSGLRHAAESLRGLLSGRFELAGSTGSAMPGGGLESGPTGEDGEPLAAGPSRVRSLFRRPGFLLFLGLTALSLLAFRKSLFGEGQFAGGMLLPAGDGASSLWATYGSGWHDTGLGSPLAAPAYLVPLAVLSTLLVGKVWLAVTLLLVLAVPLSGWSAYAVLGRIRVGERRRLVAAVAYALLPGVTGAVATGRIGTVVAAIALPPTGWLAASAVGLTGHPGSLRRAWMAGLLLAVVVAFVPLVWLFAAIAGVAGIGLIARRSAACWIRLAAVLVVPPLLLFPWTLRAIREPWTLLLEAGAPAPGLADAGLPAWQLAVASPGGPGVPSGWLTAGLLAAGLAALLSSRRRLVVAAAWLTAAVGLLGGLLVARMSVSPPALGNSVVVWPGVASLLIGGGLLVAVAAGGVDLRDRLQSYRFGWRQPLAAAVAVSALLAPVLLAGQWLLDGVSGPLHRTNGAVVPAYVSAAGSTAARPRAVLVQVTSSENASYTIVSGDGRVLGDAEVEPPLTAQPALSGAIAELLAGRGDAGQVQTLASYGLGFLVLVQPQLSQQQTLDGVGGLQRISTVDGATVWRLVPSGFRVRVVRPLVADALVPANPDAATTSVDTPLAAGRAGNLVLAESADPGWVATLDGETLKAATSDGWSQSFAWSGSPGQLVVSHQSNRRTLLGIQAGLLVLVFILALPARRRSGLDTADDEERQ